jgi:hypothetical protein
VTSADGSEWTWTADRAPELERTYEPEWGEAIPLIGDDLTGWVLCDTELPNNWELHEGVLKNSATGSDLKTEQRFEDFKLHVEFKYPEGSNSGVYLRGRYEVQIQDDYGKEPTNTRIGGVYGFLTPRINAAKPAGEWQTYDITLIGRRITVVLNQEKIIDDEEIPGVTGGTSVLDSREGEPGALVIQGNHGPVSFRKIVIVPAVS